MRDPGRTISPAVDVPARSTRCTLRLLRNSWPTRVGVGKSGEVVEAFVEVSFDGGQTWPFLRGVGSHGGDYFFRNGSLAVETTLSFELPEPNNNQRRARVILDRFMTVDTAANLDFEVDGRV